MAVAAHDGHIGIRVDDHLFTLVFADRLEVVDLDVALAGLVYRDTLAFQGAASVRLAR